MTSLSHFTTRLDSPTNSPGKQEGKKHETNPVPHLRGGHLSDQLAFQDDTSVSVNQQDPLCLKNIDFPNQEVISASAQDSWALLLEKLEI